MPVEERMTAEQYRREVIEPAGEPENPYADRGLLEKMEVAAKKLNEAPVSMKNRTILYKGNEITTDKRGKVKTINGMPMPTEHEIQSTILERLAMLPGGFFWRENSGTFQVGEEGNKRFFRAGIKGIADVMGVYKGYAIAIEVKRPGKKQSVDQRAFQQRFDQCGGVYLVCTDATTIVRDIEASIQFRKGA